MRHLLICLFLSVLSGPVFAQEGARVDGEPGVRIAATSSHGSPHWDISYGPLVDNKLDLWLPDGADDAVPVAIYFHGGGFGRGDKNGLDAVLRDSFLSRGFAVASANYRLALDARFPAPMEDAALAVQFLRADASEYGLDPDRIVTLGRSAGGILALWVAYHDDLADPASANPVLQMSTRVRGAGVINAQTTFVMDDLHAMFDAEKPPSFFANLLGPPRRVREADAVAASPLEAFSADDPPTYFIYLEEKAKKINPSRPNTFMHSQRFADPVQQRAGSVGIDVEVVEIPNADVSKAYGDMADFLATRVSSDGRH